MAYQPDAAFTGLFQAFTGNADSIGAQLTRLMNERSANDPLLVSTASDIALFPGGGAAAKIESFRKSTRGFIELTDAREGGAIFGRLHPRNEEERQAALDAGYDLNQILTTEDLVSGDDVFFSATGISDGDLLKGVRYWGNGASTQSLVMRSKSGTIRTVEATHRWQKLMRYSAFKFD